MAFNKTLYKFSIEAFIDDKYVTINLFNDEIKHIDCITIMHENKRELLNKMMFNNNSDDDIDYYLNTLIAKNHPYYKELQKIKDEDFIFKIEQINNKDHDINEDSLMNYPVLYKKDSHFISFIDENINCFLNNNFFLKKMLLSKYNKAILNKNKENTLLANELDEALVLSKIRVDYSLKQEERIAELKIENKEQKVHKLWNSLSGKIINGEKKRSYKVYRNIYTKILEKGIFKPYMHLTDSFESTDNINRFSNDLSDNDFLFNRLNHKDSFKNSVNNDLNKETENNEQLSMHL